MTKREPSPLTLLKAIGGAQDTSKTSTETATASDEPPKQLRVELVDDGVKLHLPVETTLPDVLQSFAQFLQGKQSPILDATKSSTNSHAAAAASSSSTDANSSLEGGHHLPLAFSVNKSGEEDQTAAFLATTEVTMENPLTVELKCRKCASTGPEAGARAFLMGPQPLSVVVCHNRVQSEQAEIEEILTHELVHLYDVQTLRLDLQDCENLAYSEVRAAKAAECKDSWHPHLQSYCVKQKAICATNNLFPIEGRKCIQKVFDRAFGDNRPFPDPKKPS